MMKVAGGISRERYCPLEDTAIGSIVVSPGLVKINDS
jgi:hypothetical protein